MLLLIVLKTPWLANYQQILTKYGNRQFSQDYNWLIGYSHIYAAGTSIKLTSAIFQVHIVVSTWNAMYIFFIFFFKPKHPNL